MQGYGECVVFRAKFLRVRKLAGPISPEFEQVENRCRRDGDGSGSESWNGCKARHWQLPSHRLFHLVPGGIRVIGGHRLCKLCCFGTKVLFVNGSGFADNESHHARGAVVHRISDEGESCAHLAIDDVVLGSPRCMSSLAREDPEHIPVERNMLANLVGWEILACVSDKRVDRAVELVASTVPIQTIVSAFIADQFLSELAGEFAWRARKILFLRVDQIAARIHGGNFISADAPEHDLVFARGSVEIPRNVLLHQGNRKRPVFGSDCQGHSSVGLCHEPMHLLVFDDEASASIQVFHWVAGRGDILSGWSEDAQCSLFVLCLHCVKESAAGIFGGSKGPLSRFLSEHWCRHAAQGKCEQNGYCKSNKALAFKLNKKRNHVQHGIPLHS